MPFTGSVFSLLWDFNSGTPPNSNNFPIQLGEDLRDIADGLSRPTAASGLTAGTTQTAAGGTPLTTGWVEFDTVTNPNDAATLPPALVGVQVLVLNVGGNDLQVFAATEALGGAPGGDLIYVSGTPQATFTVVDTTSFTFRCFVAGFWRVFQETPQ